MLDEKVLNDFTHQFELSKVEVKEVARDYAYDGAPSFYVDYINYIPSADACLSFIALLNHYDFKSEFDQKEDTSIITQILKNILTLYNSLDEERRTDFFRDIKDIVDSDLDFDSI